MKHYLEKQLHLWILFFTTIMIICDFITCLKRKIFIFTNIVKKKIFDDRISILINLKNIKGH